MVHDNSVLFTKLTRPLPCAQQPQQPKHTEDAEPDAKRPAETASPGQKKAQLPKAGALPSWGA